MLLEKVWDVLLRRGRKEKQSGRRPSVRPRLEALEDRLALANRWWTGGTGADGDDWGKHANWLQGARPTAADDVLLLHVEGNKTPKIYAGESYECKSISTADDTFDTRTLDIMGRLTVKGPTLSILKYGNLYFGENGTLEFQGNVSVKDLFGFYNLPDDSGLNTSIYINNGASMFLTGSPSLEVRLRIGETLAGASAFGKLIFTDDMTGHLAVKDVFISNSSLGRIQFDAQDSLGTRGGIRTPAAGNDNSKIYNEGMFEVNSSSTDGSRLLIGIPVSNHGEGEMQFRQDSRVNFQVLSFRPYAVSLSFASSSKVYLENYANVKTNKPFWISGGTMTFSSQLVGNALYFWEGGLTVDGTAQLQLGDIATRYVRLNMSGGDLKIGGNAWVSMRVDGSTDNGDRISVAPGIGNYGVVLNSDVLDAAKLEVETEVNTPPDGRSYDLFVTANLFSGSWADFYFHGFVHPWGYVTYLTAGRFGIRAGTV